MVTATHCVALFVAMIVSFEPRLGGVNLANALAAHSSLARTQPTTKVVCVSTRRSSSVVLHYKKKGKERTAQQIQLSTRCYYYYWKGIRDFFLAIRLFVWKHDHHRDVVASLRHFWKTRSRVISWRQQQAVKDRKSAKHKACGILFAWMVAWHSCCIPSPNSPKQLQHQLLGTTSTSEHMLSHALKETSSFYSKNLHLWSPHHLLSGHYLHLESKEASLRKMREIQEVGGEGGSDNDDDIENAHYVPPNSSRNVIAKLVEMHMKSRPQKLNPTPSTSESLGC